MMYDLLSYNYQTLVLAIAQQQIKDYVSRMKRIPSYNSTNKRWFIRKTVELRESIINESFASKFGIDMALVMDKVDDAIANNRKFAWDTLTDTFANDRSLKFKER